MRRKQTILRTAAVATLAVSLMLSLTECQKYPGG